MAAVSQGSSTSARCLQSSQHTQVHQLKTEEVFEAETVTREVLWCPQWPKMLLWCRNPGSEGGADSPCRATSTHLLFCASDTKQTRSSLHPKLRVLPMRQKHNGDGPFLSLGVRFVGSKPGRRRKGELCAVCATAVQAWQPECDTCNKAHDHTHIHISHARF